MITFLNPQGRTYTSDTKYLESIPKNGIVCRSLILIPPKSNS
jgi:hypothetical protein